MGEQTKISWTDHTWNPWYGCRKVSAGCKNCYMYRDMAHYGKDPLTVQRGKTTFSAPLKWKKPARVFTCSWSDWFIEEADAWRGEAWEIIRKTPYLTYQICTKRPERIKDHLPTDWGNGYPNVWLGVTAENQEMADLRISALLWIPAVVRWLSVEPMLEPIDLKFKGDWSDGRNGRSDNIHWVVVGGESGPNFRPMELDWARSIRDQCAAVRVPFFFKQESGMRPGTNPILDGKEYHEFPKPEAQP